MSTRQRCQRHHQHRELLLHRLPYLLKESPRHHCPSAASEWRRPVPRNCRMFPQPAGNVRKTKPAIRTTRSHSPHRADGERVVEHHRAVLPHLTVPGGNPSEVHRVVALCHEVAARRAPLGVTDESAEGVAVAVVVQGDEPIQGWERPVGHPNSGTGTGGALCIGNGADGHQ